MKKYVLFLLIFYLTSTCFAQEKVIPDSQLSPDKKPEKIGWFPKGVLGLNISQIAFSNWEGGGESSLAYNFLADFGLDYLSPTWKFTSFLKLTYGQTKLGSTAAKITDNDLYFENVLSYNPGWDIKPFFALLVRSSVANGYDYSVDPKVQTRGFFDPGYITETMGFIYDKPEWFQTRLGIGIQQTFTNKFPQYSDPENMPPVDNFRLDAGIESISDIQYGFSDNLHYSSKLRLFGKFDDLGVWDVRFDNSLVAKITDLVNVNLNVLLIYEKLQSPKTQVKEALQIGITYLLF